MLHVLVETNWVVDLLAPAHHRKPNAIDLLERASQGELCLHLPSLSVMEAKKVIPKDQ